jgi:hypothetical protein
VNYTAGLEVVMTLFIVLAIFGPLAIVALFWCLRGFSRELKQRRKIAGMAVRIETIIDEGAAANHVVRDTGAVVEITRRAALQSRRPA